MADHGLNLRELLAEADAEDQRLPPPLDPELVEASDRAYAEQCAQARRLYDAIMSAEDQLGDAKIEVEHRDAIVYVRCGATSLRCYCSGRTISVGRMVGKIVGERRILTTGEPLTPDAALRMVADFVRKARSPIGRLQLEAGDRG